MGTGNLQNTLFDRQQRTRLESGQPHSKINLSANYGYGIFGIEARTVRFGESKICRRRPARAELVDQTFSAKWITDLTLNCPNPPTSWPVNRRKQLFDVYPDKFRPHPRNRPDNYSVDPATSFNSGLDNTNRNRFVYNADQFGFNGGYYFARLNVTLPTK